MMSLLRWNFSSRRAQLCGGDAIVVSIPKSGRTWVRTFIAAYYCRKVGLEFTLNPEEHGAAAVPRVIYSHDWFEQRTKADLWDRVRGKYLIPRAELKRAAIFLLARDPRDAFVSLYVQMTRRTRETPDELKQKAVSDLLRDSAHGIQSMVDVMNQWLHEFSRHQNFMLVRYESLREAPEKHFRAMLERLGEQPVHADAFAHALQFSEFGNMKKMEAAGAFDSKILRPGDVQDPESFKVRRGKIGGFQEYLSVADQTFAAAAVRKLDSRFGYEA